MQTLYEWEFRGEKNLEEITKRNINEFKKDVDEEYVHKIIDGVVSKVEEIDELIKKAAPEWPIEQVARVDKNTLRVALYEMIYDESEDVPPRVSINEAIEIGKTFGSETSSKFINGVLGFVYKQYEAKLKPRDEIKK